MGMKILIGYDGSESADAALDDLRRAGLPRETETLIVSVAEVLMQPPPPSDELVGLAPVFAESSLGRRAGGVTEEAGAQRGGRDRSESE